MSDDRPRPVSPFVLAGQATADLMTTLFPNWQQGPCDDGPLHHAEAKVPPRFRGDDPGAGGADRAERRCIGGAGEPQLQPQPRAGGTGWRGRGACEPRGWSAEDDDLDGRTWALGFALGLAVAIALFMGGFLGLRNFR